jgi:hypothetical protein
MPINSPINKTNQYENVVNRIFQGTTLVSSQESEEGSQWTLLNPKTFLARTFLDIVFLNSTVNIHQHI